MNSWVASLKFGNVVFFANSFFVLWFFSTVALGDKTAPTLYFVLMSLLTLGVTLRSIKTVWVSQKWWIIALLIYALVTGVSMMLQGVSDPSSYERTAKILASVFVFVYLINYRFDGRAVAFGILFSAFLVGLYAGYEKFWLNLPRAGAITHPIRFGYMALTLGLLCLFYFFKYNQLLWKIVFFAGSCFGVFGAFLTGTRGVFVILAAAVLLALCVFLKKNNGFSLRNFYLFAFLALCFGFVVFKTNLADRYISYTAKEIEKISQGNLNTSIGTRLQLWHTAIHLGQHSPLFGVGYDYDYIQKEAGPFIRQNAYNTKILEKYRHFHNEYLDRFAKQGILGVIAWCLLLFLASSGMKTDYKYAVAIVILTLAVGGLTETVSRSSRLFYMMALGISVFRCLDYFEWCKLSRSFSATDKSGGGL